MNSIAKRTILLAAVAAVPLFGFTAGALAQARLNADGHALDASNRVGSGGRNPNDSDLRTPPQVSGNDIVTGNVTGGRQFRGRVDYTDPRAFRGNTSDRHLDNFVRQSSGPDLRLADSVQPFYGAGRGVAPPPGFQQTDIGSGTYLRVGQTVNRYPGDQRLGDINLAQPQIALPQPGELLLPGPVDPTRGQMYITASPLTGIQQFGPNDRVGTITNTQYNPVTNQLDSQSIQRMREEMNREAGLSATPGEAPPPTEQNPNLKPAENKPGAAAAGAGAVAGAAPVRGAVPINQKAIDNRVEGAKPINTAIAANTGDGASGQSLRQVMIAKPVAPELQSSVYADLLKRHQAAAQDSSMSDADAQRAFNAAQKAQLETPGAIAGAAKPGAAAPGSALPGTGAPAIPPPPGAASTEKPAQTAATGTPDFAKQGAELLKHGVPKKKAEPVKVPSLSHGVKGKGLADVLKNAEDLMKQGKFTSALDQYDQAEQVAPNQPLVRLGRANAELGAAYYARAESHLRDVLTANPELLTGQYDLNAMLGEQRLAGLIADLKKIAQKDQQESRPVFLLAYIYYNTGDAQRADGFIDLADKRTGGKDPFFKLLRDNWALPEKSAPQQPAPAPDANK